MPVTAIRGILIKVDPHIKALLVAIDEVNHDYIIEDLDEEHLLVREAMLVALKAELENRLKDTIHEESDNDTAED